MPEFCPNCMATVGSEAARCTHCGWSMSWKNKEHELPVNTILKGRYLVGREMYPGDVYNTYVGLDLASWTKVAIKEYYPCGFARRGKDAKVYAASSEYHESESPEKDFAAGKVNFTASARALIRFKDEPSVVSVHDCFEENGTAYAVTEFLEGERFDLMLKEHGRFSMSETLNILEPVMAALEKMHACGLMHWDIRPINMAQLPDGRIKLINFGIPEQHINTCIVDLPTVWEDYVPAEQYERNGGYGPWCDVYALCAVMYNMITGEIPEVSGARKFRDNLKNPSELGAAISPAQEAVLMKGLAIDSADRIRSIRDLRRAFAGEIDIRKENGRSHKPKRPAGASAARGAGKKRSRLKIMIAAAAAVLLVAAGVLIFTHASAQKDQTVIMPDVIGVDRDKAKALLEKRGLEVVEIEAESDEYAPDVVIEQSIAPGKEIEPGMAVELTINVLKDKNSDVPSSAPPMESSEPDDTDSDVLERGNGGSAGGGIFGDGSSGGYSGGEYDGGTSGDSSSSGGSGGSRPAPAPTSAPEPEPGGSAPELPDAPTTEPDDGSAGSGSGSGSAEPSGSAPEPPCEPDGGSGAELEN